MRAAADAAADERLEDRARIRELVERWALWRDAGDWDRFRTLWHDDGQMTATWAQCPVDEFIALAKAASGRGVAALHTLGGHTSDLNGDRAIAQTRMTISQRGALDGIRCDVTCTGRFYDFIERRAGRWGLVRRRLIYEKDRADPVDTSQQLHLDRALLERFPSGYRHLAYLQTQAGFAVRDDLPGTVGPQVEALYRTGAAWLGGDALDAGVA